MGEKKHTGPTNQKINQMWAFVSVDDSGNEGLIAATLVPGQGPMPFVAADPLRVKDLEPLAQQICLKLNVKCKLIKYSNRECLKDIP